MDFVSPWMDKIRTTCQRAELNHIDVIIDQCAVDFSVLPALTTFSNPMMWQSLYHGLPEDIYPEDAPVLVRVNLSDAEHAQWLQNLAAEMMESAPLLICGSCWSFEQLAVWLRDCANAQHEGREGIFRFWDSPLPAGESAALWVVGADAPVVMPRGEFYDASASEPLNLICERAVAQCDLHDDPPACVLFSHPQITRLDECGWNTTHNLQDSYWGMQGSMEPLIVISLAALFAKTEAQPCGWVSTDPQHTLALGIVKPHGKG